MRTSLLLVVRHEHTSNDNSVLAWFSHLAVRVREKLGERGRGFPPAPVTAGF